MITRLTIEQFIEQRIKGLIFDVRSPAEYQQAHILQAFTLPLFTNEQRTLVGTAYKQESREKAIRIGLTYFGPELNNHITKVEEILAAKKLKKDTPLFIYCWRGGMRSAGLSWLLDLYGFKVFTIIGGYKSYRNWVIKQLNKSYNLQLLGGYTGSAKTDILHDYAAKNLPVIDLEGLACHKGSAFGSIGMPPQPSYEMFENLLAENLFATVEKFGNTPIWIEDESQRIGNINIPKPLWLQMRKSPLIFLNKPFEHRLDYIVANYGKLEAEKLMNAIVRIQKRLGGLETKNAINFLMEGNIKACFSILLAYYDKHYKKSMELDRENVNEQVTFVDEL